MTWSTELRHAARVLRRRPTTTAIIILTLALCIGANTAIFSVVDATLLRPLPYPDPASLVRIVRHYQGPGGESDQSGQNGKAWEVIRDHATLLEAAPYSTGAGGVNFSAAGRAQYVLQQRVGAGFFEVLGVRPMIGREFTAEEDRPGGAPVAILSYGMWRRNFQGDPAIAGKTLTLRGEPYTIVGVMPQGFRSDTPVDVWTPLRPSQTGEGGGFNYAIAARLKAGVSRGQAAAQLESIGRSLIEELKLSPGWTSRLSLVSLQEGQTEGVRKPLFIVWAAVGLVLLIGCANVASLLLARAAARKREIATRMALGGGRGAIVRQLLFETLLLAGFGGAAGFLVGYGGLKGLQALGSKSFPVVNDAHLDARVLAVTALLSLIVSLLAGVFPVFEFRRIDLRTMLSEAGGRGVSGTHRRWSRRLLVAGEIAIAMLLLIGAGLMVRTLTKFYQLQPGFDPARVITASFSLQDARYATSERINRLFASGLERIAQIPGVESAGAGLTLPYERGLNIVFRRLDGPQAGSQVLLTNLVYVTPGYLETLRISLLRGRRIQAGDTASSSRVVVVNEAFAKRYLGQQDVLGSHLALQTGPEPKPVDIVGVVGDVQQSAGWGNFGPSGAVPTIYVPALQTEDSLMTLIHQWFTPSWVVRYSGDPASTTRGIQDAMAILDPMLPIAEFRTMSELRADQFSTERFQTGLLASLSGLALLLAVVGIYGLMAQSVVERTRELGIRLALGATVSQAIREATVPGLTLGAAGVISGCVLAVLSSKVIEHLIWGISATDPVTYMVISIGLLAVVGGASLVPALRITHLNPADTLREE